MLPKAPAPHPTGAPRPAGQETTPATAKTARPDAKSAAQSIHRRLKAWREAGDEAADVAPPRIHRASNEEDFGDIAADMGDFDPMARKPTVEIEENALTATPPVINNDVLWKINFNALCPSGEQVEFGHAKCEKVNGAPVAKGPSMDIDNNRVVGGRPSKIKPKGGWKLTKRCLDLIDQRYTETFHQPPGATSGVLAKSNLQNFQDEFARIKQAHPDRDTQSIADEVITKISFGTSRLEAGYKTFEVHADGMSPLAGQQVEVPHMVQVIARR